MNHPLHVLPPLAVLRRVLSSCPQQFHFAQVQNEGENLFYEISIHYRNTLVKGREVVAIPGEPPQRWILEYLPNEHAFIIKEKLIFPTFLWNVGSDKKITIGIWEIGNPPKRQLFRIPRLEE
ncbi:hypothetical protein SCLCIDRAFT_1216192 [Scleroderma citrinum Foug A]|uniref:Uncharacterized protein n=1 Tax=Scleroderma citrinum Foug A TaxID=1036808 RepID=A0A0C3DYI1_9AGAM|nr:hypothetical protein SCLCIDRAFT_1216192 [Scleroderma citrinum Foug A]